MKADLAKAEPAVEAVMQALDTLDHTDLISCMEMLKPPPYITSRQLYLVKIFPPAMIRFHSKSVALNRRKLQPIGEFHCDFATLPSGWYISSSF